MQFRVKLFRIILCCAILASTNLFSQVGRRALVDADLAPLLLDEISGERTHDYVTKISRFHRIRGGGPGSGYNASVDYVVSELEQFGLDDVHVERYKSDGFEHYLRWQSPVGWRVKSARLWMVEPSSKLICDFSHIAVSIMAYSQGGTTEADVVFVGRGNSDTDYVDKDVNGKIVFAIGGDGNGVHRKAVLERGAVGIVVGPSFREDRYDFPDLVESKRLYFKGEERPNAGWGFSLSRRQTEKLLGLVRAERKIRMKAEVDAELFDGEMPVISALIKGQTYPDKEILLMGHLDHYKPGANDNASGSAGMMEIARAMTELISAGKMERPHRSIRFLWLPEMHGAMAYVANHPDVGERSLVGINLDMIGEHYEKCRSHLTMTRPPFSNPSYLGDVVEEMLLWVSDLYLHSPRGSYLPFNYRDVGYGGGSDHVIFTDPSVGVPSLMIVHGDVFHHTSYDTPDKVDPTELRRVTTAAAMAALVIANADDSKAVDIAAFVAGRGQERLQQRNQSNYNLLRKLSSRESFSSKGPQIYRNGKSYNKIIAGVEADAVRSCQELGSKSTRNIIEKIARSLSKDLSAEQNRLDIYYERVKQDANKTVERITLSDAEKRAKSIKPKREFRGPLPRGYLGQHLAEEAKWYAANAGKAGGNMSTKMFEIANFADGTRDALWIRDAVSAEFGETDIEFVLRYFDDLKTLNLMSWKE